MRSRIKSDPQGNKVIFRVVKVVWKFKGKNHSALGSMIKFQSKKEGKMGFKGLKALCVFLGKYQTVRDGRGTEKCLFYVKYHMSMNSLSEIVWIYGRFREFERKIEIETLWYWKV